MEQYRFVYNLDILNQLNSSSSQNVSELFHRPEILTFSTFPTIVISAVFIALGIVGFSMNGFVFSIMIDSTKIRTNPSNVFTMSLIACDLLLCLLNIPLTLIWLLFKSSILTGINCKVVPFVQEFVTVMSSLIISVIAVDRQLSVQNITIKTKQNKRLSLIKYVKILISIILISLFLCVPILHYHQNHILTFEDRITKEYCVNTASIPLKEIYSVFIFLINFLIPSIALCSTLYSVRSFLNRETSKVIFTKILIPIIIIKVGNEMSTGGSSNSVTDLPSCLNQIDGGDKKVIKSAAVIRTAIVIRLLINVTTFFILCTIPVNIFNLLNDFEVLDSSSDLTFDSVFIITHFIQLTTVITNSYFYGLLNPEVNDRTRILIDEIIKCNDQNEITVVPLNLKSIVM